MATKTIFQALVDAYDCGQMDAGNFAVADETAFNILCSGIKIYSIYRETYTYDGGIVGEIVSTWATKEKADTEISILVEEELEKRNCSTEEERDQLRAWFKSKHFWIEEHTIKF